MNTEVKRLYSPNSAAHALDYSRSKIYEMMKCGVLRYVQVGATRRIPAEEIDRLAKEGTQEKARS